MSLNSVFDIAGSGMAAQGIRLNTTASNLANAQTASSSADQVYKARRPVFAAVHQQAVLDRKNPFMMGDVSGQGVGVQVAGVVESDAPLQRRYEPNHPQAGEDGYVMYPNVNVVEEMADMIAASRGFQINVEMMNSAKSMLQRVLTLGQ